MNLIGAKVKHAKFGEGIIVAVCGDFIDVAFGGDVKTFALRDFNQFFTVEDAEVGAYINKVIEKIVEERRIKAEAERVAREKEVAAAEARERELAEQPAQRRGRIERDRPTFERVTDGVMYFIVFQRDTFDVESRGNYLWAPTADPRGIWLHYWERLTQVRKGDIIFHCCGGMIQAVSESKGSCCAQIAPADPEYDRYRGQMGLKLDSLYSFIPTPIMTKAHRAQIMSTYPAGSRYAPFNSNGAGMQGYLFELDDDLAKTFLDAIMAKNPGWHL